MMNDLQLVTRSTLSGGALVASHSSAPALAKPVYVRSVTTTYTAFPFFEDSVTQRERERGPRGAKFAHRWTHTHTRRLAERGETPKSARARVSSKAARQSVSLRRSPALAGRNHPPAIHPSRERERETTISLCHVAPSQLCWPPLLNVTRLVAYTISTIRIVGPPQPEPARSIAPSTSDGNSGIGAGKPARAATRQSRR